MSHFIVIYDRQRRADPRVIRVDDGDYALRRLFAIEDSLQGDDTLGVVMLVAEDEETIRATHSHYFKSISELLDVVEA